MGNRIKAYNAAHAGGPIDRHSLNQHKTGFSLARKGKVARWVGEGMDKGSKAARRRIEASCGEVTESPSMYMQRVEDVETRGFLGEALERGEISSADYQGFLPYKEA